MIDITHKPCGRLLGRWINPPYKDGPMPKRSDFAYPNGESPLASSRLHTWCESCEYMAPASEWDWKGE